MKLTVLDQISDDLLARTASSLHEVLPGPTLIHLPGIRPEPLFVSVLLHGNEDTGWEVVRRVCTEYQGKTLPRALSILVGNVKAAAEGKRRLDQQPDFNRLWDRPDESEEARLMQEVLGEMRERKVFASIDIHNNSGFNPHYACINSLSPAFINLASGFSRTIVYFILPHGVQSLAFARLCPAVTLECGQPGDELGIEKATHFVNSVLQEQQHPTAYPDPLSYDLFHTIATIKIPGKYSISFDNSPADIRFIQGLERHNFEDIDAGTTLAHVKEGIEQAFEVEEESGQDIFRDFFAVEGGLLTNRRQITPSMLTDNISIIRQDCLCYLMERYELEWGEKVALGDLQSS